MVTARNDFLEAVAIEGTIVLEFFDGLLRPLAGGVLDKTPDLFLLFWGNRFHVTFCFYWFGWSLDSSPQQRKPINRHFLLWQKTTYLKSFISLHYNTIYDVLSIAYVF